MHNQPLTNPLFRRHSDSPTRAIRTSPGPCRAGGGVLAASIRAPEVARVYLALRGHNAGFCLV